MNNTDFKQYLAPCCAIAREAGDLILTHDPKSMPVERKDDKSPVTLADKESNDHIVAALKKLTPDIPVVAEEDKDYLKNPPAVFWLVDPLDGTKNFKRGEPEYTVNIALIKDGRPVLGVIYQPPVDALYFGTPGGGAFRVTGEGSPEPIHVRALPPEGATLARSSLHATESQPQFSSGGTPVPVASTRRSGSSIKFCYIAEGSADIYPRLGPTMEWDTAAGHAILNAAGGYVRDLDGNELVYGKSGYRNPNFIASSIPLTLRNVQSEPPAAERGRG